MADGKTPKRGQKKLSDKRGATTTGKVRNVQADQSNWRVRLQQSRIKFDDPQKDIYVAALAEHGLKGRSAQTAGVASTTVIKHLAIDPDFAEAVAAAEATYRDSIANAIHDAGMVGDLMPIFHKGVRVTEPILNEDGTHALNDKGEPRYVFAEVRQKNYRMLELEGKRIDPSYREKQTLDLNTSGGGVLLAPAGISPEDAIARNDELNAKSERAHEERMAEVKKAKDKVGAPKT